MRAHALAQDSLRHELEFDFTGVELFLKIFCAGPGKGGDNAANLAVLEEHAKLAIAGAAIVADHAKV